MAQTLARACSEGGPAPTPHRSPPPYAQQRLAALTIVAEPLFAAVFAYLLVGDRLTGLQILGGALMIGAMAAVEVWPRLALARRRRRAERTPAGVETR